MKEKTFIISKKHSQELKRRIKILEENLDPDLYQQLKNGLEDIKHGRVRRVR